MMIVSKAMELWDKHGSTVLTETPNEMATRVKPELQAKGAGLERGGEASSSRKCNTRHKDCYNFTAE